MTLMDRARALDSVLRSAVDQDRLMLEIGRIDERTAVIDSAAEELERSAVAVAELRRARHDLSDISGRFPRVREELEDAASEVTANPLLGAGDEFHEVVQRTVDETRRTSQSLTERWRQHLDGMTLPSVDEEFLALLENAGLEVTDLLRDVEGALSRITIRRARPLPAPGDVAALEDAVATLQHAVEALGALVPPEVHDFIVQASGRTGAPLDLLTEDVRVFLSENGLSGRYRIWQGRR